jgi:hypothetical protein
MPNQSKTTALKPCPFCGDAEHSVFRNSLMWQERILSTRPVEQPCLYRRLMKHFSLGEEAAGVCGNLDIPKA